MQLDRMDNDLWWGVVVPNPVIRAFLDFKSYYDSLSTAPHLLSGLTTDPKKLTRALAFMVDTLSPSVFRHFEKIDSPSALWDKLVEHSVPAGGDKGAVHNPVAVLPTCQTRVTPSRIINQPQPYLRVVSSERGGRGDAFYMRKAKNQDFEPTVKMSGSAFEYPTHLMSAIGRKFPLGMACMEAGNLLSRKSRTQPSPTAFKILVAQGL
ncbi:hypothetical protein BDK51DRAFT_38927 [Blyttiomyces helicus]|uniref:Uncharacterized protein n=1 Tax=Blyttiomyces helicus TaxID=388810 RepID=A0A4P9WGF9_9FUNG|nr:hypothetical protein BDK51DRAFT_38927 [Blyttiomyces helicus]|eukprot:RKO91899.1 hypothetical protein BDK51DRAFT_38927 [Blyttiomyces helicus]